MVAVEVPECQVYGDAVDKEESSESDGCLESLELQSDR